jgi:hypothetical protein
MMINFGEGQHQKKNDEGMNNQSNESINIQIIAGTAAGAGAGPVTSNSLISSRQHSTTK